MTARVSIEISEHVAVVKLDRADKKNAVDKAMFEALIDAGETLAADKSVRAVVLHGAGKNFCAGIDVSVFQGKGITAASGGLMEPVLPRISSRALPTFGEKFRCR